MIFGVLTLFVARADVGLAEVTNPVPVIALVVVAGIVIAGNLFPRKISFLPGMRYYAGNWDTNLWCLTASAQQKIAGGVVAIATMPAAQLVRVYGSTEAAQILTYLGYAFRAMTPMAAPCSPLPTAPCPPDARTTTPSPTANASPAWPWAGTSVTVPDQRAADRCPTAAVSLRARRGPRRPARRATDPQADPAVQTGRRRHRRVRAWRSQRRRHGHPPTLGRRRARARGVRIGYTDRRRRTRSAMTRCDTAALGANPSNACGHPGCTCNSVATPASASRSANARSSPRKMSRSPTSK